MSMMQIGELSGSLSDEFKDATRGEMKWSAIKGMRNLFAHAYASMDKQVIWEAALRDIPDLMNFCRKMIESVQE
jgi:uncharacterized protein with HEPN domain